MGTRNKIFFLPLFRVVHFAFFFLLWNNLVNLKFIKNNLLKRNSFLFQNQFLFIFINENAIITKKPFLGATCVAWLEMVGKHFWKI
jgi:hypothetical protein